jgi:hypothetical protein
VQLFVLDRIDPARNMARYVLSIEPTLFEDSSLSDLLSAELEQAMDRLYKIIETHLETARKPARGQ